MNSVHIKAYAKINLGLDVIRKREDNYHEVRMVMQTIDLYDNITLQEVDTDKIILKTNLNYLPANENNLAYKAAELIKKEYGLSRGVSIELEKHIPVAAGMAGGSSDCAAVLKGMNELFHLSLSEEELKQLGVRLGADVPYCIMGGTALSEGIGEILTRIPSMPACPLLIAKPPVHVSTKHVYEQLSIPSLEKHPDIDGLLGAIKHQDVDQVASLLNNVLETVTITEYPVIDELKSIMAANGALGALMSGSGPTVFGLFSSYQAAKKAAAACSTQNSANCVIVTSIL